MWAGLNSLNVCVANRKIKFNLFRHSYQYSTYQCVGVINNYNYFSLISFLHFFNY